MPSNYITLTRQSLYDLVWSTLMQKLAQEFGISDVALAKRCRAVDVPGPPRGWWARKVTGQDPPRIPLPRYRTREAANSTPVDAPKSGGREPKGVLRAGPEPAVPFSRTPPGTFSAAVLNPATAPEEAAFLARVTGIDIPKINELSAAEAVVRRTARHLKHPDRTALPFVRGEKTGPVLDVEVTPACLTRALLFADSFIRVAQRLGWHFASEPPVEDKNVGRSGWNAAVPQPQRPSPFGQLNVEGVYIAFRIEEPMRVSGDLITI